MSEPKPIPGLAAFGLAVAAGVVPGALQRIQAQADIEEAALRLAAVVGDPSIERYMHELERRWEFAVETARVTRRRIYPDKAALIRSMTHEIAAGIL